MECPTTPNVLETLRSETPKKVTFTYQSIPDTVTKAPEIPQDEISNGTLKHLGRKELLELMLEIRHENERIAKQAQDISNQNRTLLEQLKDKTVKINKAGTLAEATFLLNGVYESANVAAQQYLDNLQDLYDREKIQCERKEADVSEQAQRMLEDATKQCERLIKSAQERCQAMETEARTTCEAMKISAKAEAESYWKELSTRLEAFYQSHEGLKALLKDTGQLFGGDGNS
jgi:cell division septum initiation protein DivIVA